MKVIWNIILGFLILFFLVSLTRNFFEYRRNLAFYESYRREFEEEERRNVELQTKLVKSNSVPELEKTIRNDLNLLKDGEIALLIPEPTPTVVPVTPTPVPPAKQWYTLFFPEI